MILSIKLFTTIQSYIGLGDNCKLQNNLQAAINNYTLALQVSSNNKSFKSNTADICSTAADIYFKLGEVYSLKKDLSNSIKCYNYAILEYDKQSADCQNKNETEQVLRYSSQTKDIRSKMHQLINEFTDIASKNYSISIDHLIKGDLIKANVCVIEAWKIYSALKDQQHISLVKQLYYTVLVQMGNECLLNGNTLKAKNYYMQVDAIKCKNIDSESEDFIKLLLEYKNIAYNLGAMSAYTNTLLVLIKYDSKFKFGNHQQSLASLNVNQAEPELAPVQVDSTDNIAATLAGLPSTEDDNV